MRSTLQPAYWGSLLSLIVICIAAISDYLANQAGDPASLIYIVFVAAFCLLVSIRYYIAVSVSIYSGWEKTVLDLPYPLNAVTFSMLVVLLLACNFMIAAFGIFGPQSVLLQFHWVVILSLIVSAILWIGSKFRPKTIFSAPLFFVFIDAVILASILVYRTVSNFVDPNKASEAQNIIGMVTAILILMLCHEGWKIFVDPLRVQMGELKSVMLKTRSN